MHSRDRVTRRRRFVLWSSPTISPRCPNRFEARDGAVRTIGDVGDSADRTFPGFQRCMWMMRRHNPQTQEEGFGALRPRAREHVQELIHEFRTENDHGLRCWLLELIGDAESEDTFEILAEQLRGPDPAFRSWAILGLERLESKAARRLLWEARSWEIEPPEDRDYFRRELAEARGRRAAQRD
jgi:hypothetical protein